MSFGCEKNPKSTLPAIGAIDSNLKIPVGRYMPSLVAISGLSAAYIQAIIEEMAIPASIDPFKFFLSITPITNKPIKAKITVGER